MPNRETQKLKTKKEQDDSLPEDFFSPKCPNFASARLALKEMNDIFDYLDGRKKEPHVPMKADPSCKFGRYGDLFAKSTASNPNSQNWPEQARDECMKKSAKN